MVAIIPAAATIVIPIRDSVSGMFLKKKMPMSSENGIAENPRHETKSILPPIQARVLASIPAVARRHIRKAATAALALDM